MSLASLPESSDTHPTESPAPDGVPGKGREGEPARHKASWLRRLAPVLLAAGAIATLFTPVLRFGPVAEDFLFAVDGIWIREEPRRLLAPLQQVWRPGARIPFALAAPFGEEGLNALRLGQWAGGIALALLGFAALRRLAHLPRWLAAWLSFWWLASPVGNEIVCGESAYLGHAGLIGCVLGVLVLWDRSMSWRRLAGIVVLTAGAMACGEAWVMLPLSTWTVDAIHFRMPWQQWLRRTAGWLPALASYLAVYWSITSFGYRALYSSEPEVWLSKLTSSAAVVMHLAELSPVPAALGNPGSAVIGAFAVLLALALTAMLARTGRSGALVLLLGTALFALPTLSSAEQYGRWLMLPWLGVLGGLGALLHSTWLSGKGVHRFACTGLAVLAVSLSLKDLVATHGDIRDWLVLSQLTRQLEAETPTILQGTRAGDFMVVLRAHDSEPLARLLRDQKGVRKWFVPRPDDPYGVAPLAALLSWQSREDRLVFRRVRHVFPGETVHSWRHETGRFVRMPSFPGVLVRHPAHPTRGTPGVILEVQQWSELHLRGLTD